MENKIKQDAERWVEERMALLAAPDKWEPDADAARRRLQGRLSARRPTMARIWLPRVVTISLVCLVLIFAIPATRVRTLQIWQWLTIQKVEVVQGDFERLDGIWLVPQMEEKRLQPGETPPPLPTALDFAEAVRRAGFTPRLPREGVPPGAPVLRVFDSMVWSSTLKAADLESSLRRAGVNDQPIPKEWDGAQVSFHIDSSILAEWPGTGMFLMQNPPITLSAPGGVDITEYWTAALRAAGISRWQAQLLAGRMRTAPTLLFGIASKSDKTVREVQLRTGPATLIESINENGRIGHVMLIWSVADRYYYLNARSEEQAVMVANSIE